jgi:hypothetical protein
MMWFVDTVQSCLLLKGLPRHFYWHNYRRFCTWTQYDTPSRGLIIPVLGDQGGLYPRRRLAAHGSLGKPKGQLD